MRRLTPRNCYSPAMLVYHRTQTVSFVVSVLVICFPLKPPVVEVQVGVIRWPPTFHRLTVGFSPSFSLERNEPSTLMVPPIGPTGRNKGRDSVDRSTLKPIPKICRKGNLLRKPTCIVYKYLCFLPRTNTHTSCIHMSNKKGTRSMYRIPLSLREVLYVHSSS